MRLKHLSLTNFRNFARLDLALTDGVTIMVGANAQGKTSLLDAIHYLTSAQSPHTADDRQLIHFAALQDSPPFARIVAEIQRNQQAASTEEHQAPDNSSRSLRIEIRIVLNRVGSPNGQRLRREVLINGVKRRVRQLAGVFNTVMFLPKDMRVVEGSPIERRRFLDDALCQSNPPYAQSLADYGTVIAQRNALLKQLQERSADRDQLTYWDEKICEHAATLICARSHALLEIDAIAQPIHHDLSRGQESLRLEYLPSPENSTQPQGEGSQELLGRHPDLSEDRVQSAMMTALKQKREEEIARGATTIGPHRDDFRFLANDIDLRFYGSRGQNRTAMLATQLAEVDWLRHKTGEHPVLLLDEVMSELDPNRREDLLKRLSTAQQAILTSADLNMFTQEFRSLAVLRTISNGIILPYQET